MGKPLNALLSLHDVMPETLDRVEEILRLLRKNRLSPCTLLVVPGKDWSPTDLARLEAWAKEGWLLAAHGWKHKADRIQGGYHRFHSMVLSRDVAEHLERDSKGILALMARSGQWFVENGFSRPRLYVPPAWALGFLRGPDRSAVPFPMVETLTGVIRFNGRQRRQRRLPLCGYEADTRARARFLHCFNASQRLLARSSGRPLRISIHPDDLSLHMGERLRSDLHRPLVPLSYEYAVPA
ncbi:MAG: DUF2334 domain-containing protein [Verrucomicrobia bacterium]|jgi:hypothetical protein|nr:DUF2334 domain-containing protein [Verrucomicrobiota bacterium]